MKVSELAKELDRGNKEMLEALASLGIAAKAHNSSISEEDAQRARDLLAGKSGARNR